MLSTYSDRVLPTDARLVTSSKESKTRIDSRLTFVDTLTKNLKNRGTGTINKRLLESVGTVTPDPLHDEVSEPGCQELLR